MLLLKIKEVYWGSVFIDSPTFIKIHKSLSLVTKNPFECFIQIEYKHFYSEFNSLDQHEFYLCTINVTKNKFVFLL